MSNHGGFFGPQNMWLGLGIIAAILFGWRAVSPVPDLPKEPVAQLQVLADGRGHVEQITRQDCVGQDGRVWIAIEGGVECIAYVAAGASTTHEIAVVYFGGDVPAPQLRDASGATARVPNQRRADALSAAHKLPVVIVGRPGLMGSTGNHLLGGRRDEAQVIDAALDAIKDKLGLRRLALAGQSGGSRIIAQLMVMGRRDIACAAMASGAFDVPRLHGGGWSPTNIFGDPGRRYLVPLREIAAVPVDPGRRAFVIGDTRDEVIPFSEQRSWADKLVAAGHHAVLIEAEAKDPEHHGLSPLALTAAALCAAGRSDADIRSAVVGK